MATKRLRSQIDSNTTNDNDMCLDSQILSSDINNIIQANPIPVTFPYHTSVCGSILHSSPSNSPAEIFSYLRHSNFDAFRRSLDVYHQEIIEMKNDLGQTVLHVLVIHAHQYLWIRLLMMRGCDTCAQDNDGYTAAHYAVERDDVEMLKALTTRFQSPSRPIPEQQIETVYQKSMQALTCKEKQGLTPFMLACHRDASKCLNYLIDLKFNDSHVEDQYGDTCLHYAVARRNLMIVEKLITQCHANVNGGNPTRPSVLDVLQYNRQQQKPFEQNKDNDIEKFLLSHQARNRCAIRRVVNKRKGQSSQEESMARNLASLSLDLNTNGPIETGRSHARVAASLQSQGDLTGAQSNYELAMTYTPENTLDWPIYAFQLAIIHQARGEIQPALQLFQKALDIRERIETNSEDIDRLRQAIYNIQHQATS